MFYRGDFAPLCSTARFTGPAHSRYAVVLKMLCMSVSRRFVLARVFLGDKCLRQDEFVCLAVER